MATSVFDLMGRTEETELRISQTIDQLFQVFVVLLFFEVNEFLICHDFQEMDTNGDGVVSDFHYRHHSWQRHHRHGYPAHSHHDKIPTWWGNVSNDKGRNMSVTKSHHT